MKHSDSSSKNKHRPRKRFGQNFLTDEHYVQRIINSIAPKKDQHLVEIGPGQGAITQHLIEHCARLDLIEIDRDLAQHLEQLYQSFSHVHINVGDVLDFDFSTLQSSFRLIGNLPYNISTPLLIKLIDYQQHIQDAHFMLQKEVVERICAQENEKNYGRLSVVLQYYFDTEHLFDVPPGAFYPPPKVNSAILRLKPRAKIDEKLNDEKAFQTLIKTCFAQRRKTMRNNLKREYDQAMLGEIESLFDLSRRPETFSLSEFVTLGNFISGKQ